jgi:hypothetical protein
MKLRAEKFRFFKTDRGVTMVEFALVLPLLMLLLIGIIDVSRYFAYQAILNKGAENGLNLALKVPNLDVDLALYQPTDLDYQRYQQARGLVIQSAVDVPMRTFFSDSSTDSIAKLVNYSYIDPGASTSELDAGLIFPGQALATSDGATVAHKTFPNPPTAQTKEDLLKQHPIMVELRAEVRPLTPFMQPITLRARAMGYREEIPRGPLTGEFGLVDPVAGPPGSSSSSSSSSTNNLPVPSNEETCDQNWLVCSNTGECPNVNFTPPFPPAQCPCDPCDNDIGLGEKLGL